MQTTATLDPSTKRLRIHPLTTSIANSISHSETFEISTIYFRAGYTPNDYPTPSHYATRKLLERSLAIKCPSIPLQLAGGKKVQQVLTNPGVLESFLTPSEPASRGDQVFAEKDLADIRATWVEMWGLDEPGGYDRAHDTHMNLVLKPQREGGGNNIYKSSIPTFLDKLPEGERSAWIAMQLIQPPKGGRESTGNWLVRAGGAEEGAVQAEVVSELGIFGWALFGKEGEDAKKVNVEEKEAGWLLRTKGTESDEGGVAAGFSVLDSLLLIDVESS